MKENWPILAYTQTDVIQIGLIGTFPGGVDSDDVELVAGELDMSYGSGNEQRRDLDYFIIHPGSESSKYYSEFQLLVLFRILCRILFRVLGFKEF